jgi:serine/threonine-protein kinase
MVALKNINRDRLTTHRFLRELRFLLSLEHPNIANCRALELSDSGRQLVLDYCEGGTLRQLIDQLIPLTLAEILSLTLQNLEALEHAHGQGIVHCDIKPENILLCIAPEHWQIKVSDFGIARLSQELRGKSYTGATGSPAYMAPERFYYQHSAASDLYAIGIILFELLTGDRPFSGTPEQLMVAHLNQLPKIPASLPEPLRLILRRALQKLPGRRYKSVAQMKADLIAYGDTLNLLEKAIHFPLQHHDYLAVFTAHPAQPWSLPIPELAISTEIAASGTTTRSMEPEHHRSTYPALVIPQGQQVYAAPLSETSTQPSTQPWSFPSPVSQVLGWGERIMAVADRTLFELGPNQSRQQRVTFPEPVRLLEPGHQDWLFAQSQTTRQRVWRMTSDWRVAPTELTLPALNAAGASLLPLDNRYLLLTITTGTTTQLQILTRRGQVLGYLALNTAICPPVRTQTPLRLLAQEIGAQPALLIIDLKPYRVRRCRLDRPCQWLGELALGYGAISDAGHFRLINSEGQLIGQIDQFPIPTAIAWQPPYHIWLATQTETGSALQKIDIRDLALDIIF